MNATDKQRILVIVGPTASGKSSLAMEIARRIPSEIVSADSRQVYRFLDIGTAKPTHDDRAEVPHHCIDIRDPGQQFNAGDFLMAGREAITSIISRKKLPIVCGGTGLYIRALIDGFFQQPDLDGKIRTALEERIETEGKEALYAELQRVDPVSAHAMDASKYRRVIRALEVYYETGIPISRFHAEHAKDDVYDATWFGFDWNRIDLYKRINDRVDTMISAGFLDEVSRLQAMGFDDRFQSLQTVGYKEAFRFARGEISRETMIGLMKQNTRRFAKRQLTWFRKENRIQWHQITAESQIDQISKVLSDIFRS